MANKRAADKQLSETTPTPAKWEVVQQDGDESKTERLKIDEGWLYRTTSKTGAVAMVFVSSITD